MLEHGVYLSSPNRLLVVSTTLVHSDKQCRGVALAALPQATALCTAMAPLCTPAAAVCNFLKAQQHIKRKSLFSLGKMEKSFHKYEPGDILTEVARLYCTTYTVGWAYILEGE